MQTLVQVVCTKGRSLRDAITSDSRITDFELEVVRSRQPGRSRGWAKIRSTHPDRRGALNIEWHSGTSMLTCRVVNRGAGRPHRVLGDFVNYLFERHRRRIEALSIIPR